MTIDSAEFFGGSDTAVVWYPGPQELLGDLQRRTVVGEYYSPYTSVVGSRRYSTPGLMLVQRKGVKQVHARIEGWDLMQYEQLKDELCSYWELMEKEATQRARAATLDAVNRLDALTASGQWQDALRAAEQHRLAAKGPRAADYRLSAVVVGGQLRSGLTIEEAIFYISSSEEMWKLACVLTLASAFDPTPESPYVRKHVRLEADEADCRTRRQYEKEYGWKLPELPPVW